MRNFGLWHSFYYCFWDKLLFGVGGRDEYKNVNIYIFRNCSKMAADKTCLQRDWAFQNGPIVCNDFLEWFCIISVAWIHPMLEVHSSFPPTHPFPCCCGCLGQHNYKVYGRICAFKSAPSQWNASQLCSQAIKYTKNLYCFAHKPKVFMSYAFTCFSCLVVFLCSVS